MSDPREPLVKYEAPYVVSVEPYTVIGKWQHVYLASAVDPVLEAIDECLTDIDGIINRNQGGCVSDWDLVRRCLDRLARLRA